jgi:hypothetical protein
MYGLTYNSAPAATPQLAAYRKALEPIESSVGLPFDPLALFEGRMETRMTVCQVVPYLAVRCGSVRIGVPITYGRKAA